MSSLHPVRAHLSGVTRAILAVVATLGLLVGLAPVQAMAADQATTGSISGTISDVNGPIAGAQVSVYTANPFSWLGFASTDADGRYTVDDLSEGSYLVELWDGAHIGGYYVNSSQVTNDSGSATVVTVTAGSATTVSATLAVRPNVSGTVHGPDGQPVANATVCVQQLDYTWCSDSTYTDSTGVFSLAASEAGSYRLVAYTADYPNTYYAAAGSSSDRVRGDILDLAAGDSLTGKDITLVAGGLVKGSVTSSDGELTAGSVQAYQEENGTWQQVGPTASIGSDGAYQLALAEGSYRLRFSGYASGGAWYLDQWYQNTYGVEDATPVTVRTGQPTTLDPVVLGVQPTISGKVTDPSGTGVAGATVCVGSGYCSSSVQTGSDGSFTLSVSPGEYQLFAYSDDYPNTYVSASGSTTDRSQAKTIDLKAGDTSTQNIQLIAGAVVHGTLTGLSGGVSGYVSVSQQGNGDYVASKSIDSSGSYKLALPPGSYVFFFYSYSSSPSYQSVDKTVTVGVGDTTLDVALTPNPTVSGTVRDKAGVAVANALVCAEPVSPAYWRQCGYTEADGSYSISYLGASKYTVKVTSPDYVTTYYATSGSVTAAGAATVLNLAAKAYQPDTNITLVTGATVSGTVSFESRPVSSASVCLADGTCVATEDDGTYSIHAAPGSVTLTANWYDDDSMTTLSGTTQLSTQDATSYPNTNIAISPGTGLRGTVSGITSDDDAYATIYRLTADGDQKYVDEHYLQGNDHHYVFRDLAAGKYVVKISASGYTSAYVGGSSTSLVTVTKDAITDAGPVTLSKLAEGSLTGKAVDSSGTPLDGVTVTASRAGDTRTVTTTASGGFTFASLAAGVDWKISFAKAGYIADSSYQTPRPGRTTNLGSFHLMKPAGLSGTLRDSDGNAVAGTRVYSDGNGSVTTGSDGSFAFSNLAPGTVSLRTNSTNDLMSASRTVKLPEGAQLTGQDLVMQRPATVSGTLTDEHGNPVSGYVELVASTDDEDDYTSWDSAGSNGRFEFDWVPSGSYTILAYSDDFQDTWLGGKASRADATWFPVDAGSTVTDQNIQFAALGGVTVSGTVRTHGGQPASGISVNLTGDDDDAYAFASTDATGAYSAAHVDPGTYSAYLEWDSTTICAPWLTLHCSPDTVTVGDAAVTGKDFTLPQLGSISGTVTGPDSSDYAYVYLTDGTDEEIAETYVDGGSGTYRIDHVPYGTYTLSVGGDDMPESSRTITVAGDDTNGDIGYSAGHSISGTIHNASGEDWIDIRAFDSKTGDRMSSTELSPDGADDVDYTLTGLSTGDYLLYVETATLKVWYLNGTSNASSAKKSTPVSVANADVTGKDFTLAASAGSLAKVSGTLRLPTGVTVGDSDDYPELSFVNADTGDGYSPQIRDDGSYQVKLPLGVYQATIARSDYLGTARQEQTVDVRADKTVDFTLTLGGSLSGRVVDADGLGIEDAKVTATTAAGVPTTEHTDAWGFWRIPSVASGQVSLAVTASGYVSYSSSTPYSVTDEEETDTGTVTLKEAGRLQVHLPRLAGSPTVTIVVTDTAGNELARKAGYADNDWYTISGLPVGDVLVRFEGKLIVPEWWQDKASQADAKPITLSAGSAKSISPTLALNDAKPGTIRGTVTNATGDDGTIWVMVVDDTDTWTAPVADDGTYSLELPPGTDYKVRAAICLGLWMGQSECSGTRVLAWHGGPTRADATEVTVVSEQSTTIDLTLGDTTPTFTTAPKPTISGDPTVGSTLTATAGTWDPEPDSVAYQWLRGGQEIAGATGATYKLVNADAGSTISVKATAAKSGYQTTSRMSDATLTVVDLTSGAAPAITGAAQVGKTLTASDGGWPAGGTLTRQWKSGEAVVGTDSSTYVPVADDVGKTITVTVTWSKTGYPSSSRTSSAYGPVLSADTPQLQAGTAGVDNTSPKVGQTLTATSAGWPAGASLTYQWLRGGSPITDETAATHVVTVGDAGKTLQVTITGHLAGYVDASVTSAATAVVGNGSLAAGTVKIDITAPVVGQTLTASASGWPDGVSVAYQWQRAGTNVATGATYSVTGADQGKVLTVVATISKPGYDSATASASTSAVSLPKIAAGTLNLDTTSVKVGDTVKAVRSGWPAGVSFAYQWLRDGAAIGGAVGDSYVATVADQGARLSVKVTYSQDGYLGGSLTSDSTSAVAPAVVPNQDFTSAPTPTVTGTAKIGSTLTATVGTWAPAPDSLAIQWLRGGVAIPGATKATYKVAAADAGLKLTVQVTGSKAGYNAQVRPSAATKAVPYLGKTKAATPKISGTAKVGKTLKAKAGTWKPKGYKFTYQWFRSGVAISGATKTSYKLTAADKGKKLTVKVTGKNPGYQTVTKASKATAKVK